MKTNKKISNLRPFKTCSCGNPLRADELKWIGEMDGMKGQILSLFNCPKCHSTGCVKIMPIDLKEKK